MKTSIRKLMVPLIAAIMAVPMQVAAAEPSASVEPTGAYLVNRTCYADLKTGYNSITLRVQWIDPLPICYNGQARHQRFDRERYTYINYYGIWAVGTGTSTASGLGDEFSQNTAAVNNGNHGVVPTPYS
ncbi:MAG TPA: hypothetical protein GX743_12225 [Actinomycetales bacterium]|nr:hypothetical protein [Actinomycetales bacterium]